MMFDKKTKIILSSIFFIGFGLYVADKAFKYRTYKMIKNIDIQLKKNSWEYYD